MLLRQKIPEDEMTTARQKKKVHQVMHEHKKGKLKSGSGKKVRSRKQAIAIAMSESGQSKESELNLGASCGDATISRMCCAYGSNGGSKTRDSLPGLKYLEQPTE
jgi:hypothetical protein